VTEAKNLSSRYVQFTERFLASLGMTKWISFPQLVQPAGLKFEAIVPVASLRQSSKADRLKPVPVARNPCYTNLVLFNGNSRTRLPVAAKIALHSAGTNGGTPGSPIPAGGESLSTKCTFVCNGASRIRATG
jgi:hypothetical protein